MIFRKEAGPKSWTLFLLRLSPDDTFFIKTILNIPFLDKVNRSNEGYFVIDVSPIKLVEIVSTFI